MGGKAAIIPARGGSKRLPRKNVLKVEGKPMLCIPWEVCVGSGLFDKVLISTEAPEIAEIALGFGAEVLERPEHLATDASTVVQVCVHALRDLGERGFRPEMFCCVYATAILIRPHDLIKSLALMEEEPVPDVVMGVSEYLYPPVQALREAKDGLLERMWPQYEGQKSQRHPRLLVSNGTIYWARTEQFLREPTFYAMRLKGYVMPFYRAVDINTAEDLQLARVLLKARNG